MKLWDLRKLKNFHTINMEGGAAVSSVQFDFSGQFLAVGSSETQVYETKTWSSLVAFAQPKGAVSGVGFGAGAATIACATKDGVVKLYGAA